MSISSEEKEFLDRLIFINTEFSKNKIEPEIQGIDKFITNYESNIVINWDKEKKPLEILGQFNILELNIRLSGLLEYEILNKFEGDLEVYKEFYELLNSNKDQVYEKYDRILYVTNPILKDEYRGKKILPELVEHIYRTLYSDRVLIIFLVKPLQELKNLFFFYRAFKQIVIKTEFNKINVKQVSANEYFKLDDLVNKYDDLELQNYKLFDLAKSSGLKKMKGTTNLFYLSEHKVLENIKNKIKKV
jgi:hypothetical protein